MTPMGTVWISARIDAALGRAVENRCRSNGVATSHFVREALIDRLEALEDTDVERIRHEPTRPLADVLADLELGGRDGYR